MPTANLTVKEIRLQNLLKLLDESGLTKSAFAVKVKTSPAYLSQMLSLHTKRDMGNIVARNIEMEFKKPRGWMDSVHSAMHGLAEAASAKSPVSTFSVARPVFSNGRSSDESAAEEAELPFFMEMELPERPGISEVGIDFERRQRIGKASLQSVNVSASAAVCITVTGNSMEPVLPDGATAGVDTAKTAVKDGDIYAIDHAGSLRVKMIYKLPGGGLRLRSFNSEEWPDEYHHGSDAGQIRILGRIFWWSVLR
jgi:phage repressor protein C with HTH and peptisase S24 domain